MESILSKIAEYTIEPIGRLLGRQVGYVIYCKSNLQNMQAKVEELKAERQAIENQVAEAERKGEKIQPVVQLWLTKVDEITAQVDGLLNDECQAKLKCLHGFCPNLTVRHQLSRKSTKLVEEVVEHSGKRSGFSQVSCGILRKDVWSVTTGDYQPFQSRMAKVKQIMDHLKDSKTERMGVCGVGGVGKTTLVKEIYKKASEDKKLFDDVIILLDVKKDPNLEAIQKTIVEQLGMEILQTETKVGRASRLCGRIQGKKVLVILDDVQEKIDLEAVGLPRLPTCKVLLTCRSRQVFDEMRVDKVFQLDLLDKQDTWNLFVKMAGDVINQNTGIRDVAIKIAERCGGLPLLVVTVASALKQTNKLHAWKDALRRLKGFDKEELIEKAYLALEWSYHRLDDKELKPLFLLCGVRVGLNCIDVQDLLKYGMGLSLFKNVNTVEEARDALDTLLEKLKDSCLLLDNHVDGNVRMHDLVCHVAKRIAYRDQHVLSVEYGGELKEWPDKDFLRKCTKISLPSIEIPTLSEIPLEFPELELFFWRSKYYCSVEIPSNFFREMPKLKVLDLSDISMPSLPLSLQYLKKLRTLCLNNCTLGDITLIGQLSNLDILSIRDPKVKELPKEIGQLTRLRLLDLSYCRQLKVIPPTVISSLVRLEYLSMRFSFDKWGVEGEGSNASLLELKHLSQLSALEINIPNADVLPANLFSHKLERFNIFIGDAFIRRSLWQQTTLNTLKLKLTKRIKELDEGLKLLLKRSEDLSLDEKEVVIIKQLNAEDFEHLKHLELQNSIADIINRKVVFPNLSTLSVHRCDNLRFLFSFSMARSLVQLTQLQISSCKLMQEIVSSTRECGETDMNNMFSKLQNLNLEGLPNLARFGTGNYIEFSSLEELKIKDCDELVEFIGDKVAMSSKGTIIGKEIEQRVSEEEDNHDVRSEIVVQCFLFNEKVGFPSLARLSMKGIRKMKAIWHVQLAHQDSFRRLRQVEVWQCDNLISFFPPSVKTRLNASIASSPDHDQLNYYQNLDSIHIYMCNSLKNIFPASAARGLQQLTQLNVSDCSGIEEIVCKEEEEEVLETTPREIVSSTIECGEANMDNMFYKLKVLNLEKLPNLVRFGTGNFIEFSSLEELKIKDCDELVEFIGDKVAMSSKDTIICKEIEQRVLEEEDNHDVKSEIVVPYFLFSKKVGFPSLERLSIKGIRKVNAIWHVQLGEDSFRRLKQVKVQRCDNLICLFPPSVMGRLNASKPDHDQLKPFYCQNLDSINICECNSLKNIFPASIARGLQQLTQLHVEDCFGIEEIVGEEKEEVLEITPPQFVFPKVTSVTLFDLPQLRRFYPRLHASRWPLLKTVNMVRCAKVGIFAAEFSMFGEKREMDSLMSQQPLFIIDKDSFLNLEYLVLSATTNEIWNGPTPAELVFGKLKSFTFYGTCAPFSKQAWVLFLERLQNLEKIEMRLSSSSYEEIFVNGGISSSSSSSSSRGDISDDDDAVGSATLPRVRILKLRGMYELKHLGNDNSQSAAAAPGLVLLPNLEILEVEYCERLKTLGSLSAISFWNLTTLIVEACEGLEYLTTYSVAKSLVQLTTLKVGYCDNILVILASNDEDDDAAAAAAGNINEIIAFRRLQRVELYELPRLQGFCSGNCRLPSEVTFNLQQCPIIQFNIIISTHSMVILGPPIKISR